MIIFSLPFILPFIVLGFIRYFFIFIFRAPIEIVKYKKSAFYNKYKKKYRLGVTRSHEYKLLNYLAEMNRGIVKVNLDYGYSYFFNDENLFIPATFESMRFNDENMKWEIGNGFNFEAIDEYIEKELTYISNDIKNRRIRILVKYDTFNEKDINNALINDDFIIYKSIKELAYKIESL